MQTKNAQPHHAVSLLHRRVFAREKTHAVSSDQVFTKCYFLYVRGPLSVFNARRKAEWNCSHLAFERIGTGGAATPSENVNPTGLDTHRRSIVMLVELGSARIYRQVLILCVCARMRICSTETRTMHYIFTRDCRTKTLTLYTAGCLPARSVMSSESKSHANCERYESS